MCFSSGSSSPKAAAATPVAAPSLPAEQIALANNSTNTTTNTNQTSPTDTTRYDRSSTPALSGGTGLNM